MDFGKFIFDTIFPLVGLPPIWKFDLSDNQIKEKLFKIHGCLIMFSITLLVVLTQFEKNSGFRVVVFLKQLK